MTRQFSNDKQMTCYDLVRRITIQSKRQSNPHLGNLWDAKRLVSLDHPVGSHDAKPWESPSDLKESEVNETFVLLTIYCHQLHEVNSIQCLSFEP